MLDAPARDVVEQSAMPGPMRVVFVDADRSLPDVSTERDRGGRYTGVVVFVLRRGRLIGEVELPLPAGGLTAGALEEHLRAALGTSFDTAGTAPQPEVLDNELPFISVVVPTTMSRLADLDRCVASLTRLDYPTYEVILVDTRPDATPGRAALHRQLCADPRVRVATEAYPGISAARNTGVRLASGSIVAFTDDDAEADPNWLRAIGNRFAAEPDVVCVTGLVLPAELETPAQIWFERSGSKLEQRGTRVSFRNDGSWQGRRIGWLRRRRFEVTASWPEENDVGAERHMVYRAGKFGMGANMAFRVDAVRRIGWFDEALGTGTTAKGAEDIAAIALVLYQGGGVTLDPAVMIHHYHRRDENDLREQMYGYGVGLTAAFVAMVRADPRHVFGLLYLAAPAFRVLARKSANRSASNYPAYLSRVETRGMLVGPFAYLRSRYRYIRNGRAAALAAANRQATAR